MRIGLTNVSCVDKKLCRGRNTYVLEPCSKSVKLQDAGLSEMVARSPRLIGRHPSSSSNKSWPYAPQDLVPSSNGLIPVITRRQAMKSTKNHLCTEKRLLRGKTTKSAAQSYDLGQSTHMHNTGLKNGFCHRLNWPWRTSEKT